MATTSTTKKGDTRPKFKQLSLRGKAHRIFKLIIAQWFLLGLGVVVGLAYQWPNVWRTDGVLKAQYTVHYGTLAIIFFISGLSLSLSSLGTQFLNLPLHIATQTFSFLVLPALCLGISAAARAGAGTTHGSGVGEKQSEVGTGLDRWGLAGMLVMAVTPTTVASNVVMTGQAGGDAAATTIEVIIGNAGGAFLSPLLLSLFLSDSVGFGYASPSKAGGGLGVLYKQLCKTLGLALLLPLCAGEVIQTLWPRQTKQVREKFKFSKIATFVLLLNIWSTFSDAFYSGAFQSLSSGSIVFIVLVDVGLYFFCSIVLFSMAQIPMFRGWGEGVWECGRHGERRKPNQEDKKLDVERGDENEKKERPDGLTHIPRNERRDKSQNLSSQSSINTATSPNYKEPPEPISQPSRPRLFTPEHTISLCFCAPAKSIVVGNSAIHALYGHGDSSGSGITTRQQATLLLSLTIYQLIQVAFGQGAVVVLKRWMKKLKEQEQRERKHLSKTSLSLPGSTKSIAPHWADEDNARHREGFSDHRSNSKDEEYDPEGQDAVQTLTEEPDAIIEHHIRG